MTSQAYTLSQIVSQLGGEWKGEDIAITAVRPLDQAQAEHISFLANPKYKAEVHDSQAGAKHSDDFGKRVQKPSNRLAKAAAGRRGFGAKTE